MSIKTAGKKNQRLWLFTALVCAACILTLGIFAMAEVREDHLRVSVTLESRSISGINGGAVRQLTLVRQDNMHDDYVELAQYAPVWYIGDDTRAFVFFGSRAADCVTAKACDGHGNEQELRTAQNIIHLPDEPGVYTIGVWADRGRDTALYAFRIHVVG